MFYIADTHSLIWFLAGEPMLSLKAKEAFEQAEKGLCTIVIPTIILAELLYICEHKGKKQAFFSVLEKIQDGTNYTPYDLDIEVIFSCKGLIKIPELHDKIIAATARLLNAPIITKDNEIINSGYVKIVW